MPNQINFSKIQELVDCRDVRRLCLELAEYNEVDIAHFIEELSVEKAMITFRTLPKDMAAEVFSHLLPETQKYIIQAITDQELAVIIEELFVDDVVDLLEELPANVVKRILKNAHPERRLLINQFLKYPEDSAGSIMTAEFTDLRKNMTVAQAIQHIRCTGEDRETIYTCYVLNDERILEGVVTVRDLLLSEDTLNISDIMETNLIKMKTTDDQEKVAQLFLKYDLLAAPVVDQEDRLVGIITVDDIVDIMEEEATEDFEKMAAMMPSERPYLKTGVLTHAKNRIPWLLVLMISGMITGQILGRFESAFLVLPLLVTFIPQLTDTGGNAGSQSSTLIIRGMAVSEVYLKDFLKVLWKELRVSIVVGIVLGFANYLRILLFFPGSSAVALTVSIALLATVVVAKTVGGVLPMAAKYFKLDPAIMASPLITTIVDAFALIIYFSVAEKILHL